MDGMRQAPGGLYRKFACYFALPTVDVVVRDGGRFVLTRRIIPPYRGMWHLPGGIIRRGERMEAAARRVARAELGLEVRVERFLGTYENPARARHDISHVFIARIAGGKARGDFQSSQIRFFQRAPRGTIPYHRRVISDARRFLG